MPYRAFVGVYAGREPMPVPSTGGREPVLSSPSGSPPATRRGPIFGNMEEVSENLKEVLMMQSLSNAPAGLRNL